MKRSTQDGDDLQRNGFRVKVSEKDTLKFNGMLTSVDSLILKKIFGTSGLDRIDQFPIYIQCAKRGDEILPGETKGTLYASVGGSKDDETMGRILFPYLSMSKGITESSPLKINVRCNHSL
jgi:hypothetical protein